MSPSVAIIGTRGYPSYYGGFETAVRRLAPYLVDHGWDVTVYGRPGSIRTDDPLRDMRVKSIETRGFETKSFSTLSYGFTSAVDAARRKPDVALVMNVANGYWLPILRSRGVPTLVNVDGIEWDRAKWGRVAKGVFRSGAHATARFGTRMVYDSKEIAARWKRDFGLDGEFIPYGGDAPGKLPIEEGLSHRAYVLAVARFVPENTIPEFVAAAARIGQKYPVVIVGSAGGYGGEVEDQVRALSHSTPNVRWLGHISDDRRLYSLWQHAGAYFHGHSVGGTNPALVQAMSCGAPIVARDTVYNREVLNASGMFVAPTPDAISDGVLALMSDRDRQESLSKQAFARGQTHYTWDGVCNSYEQALRKLIKTR